jgi:hypothetical protein
MGGRWYGRAPPAASMTATAKCGTQPRRPNNPAQHGAVLLRQGQDRAETASDSSDLEGAAKS